MVQIPSYQAQQSLDAPAYPRVQVDDSIGQALTRVGSAAMAAGNNLGDIAAWERNRERQKQDFNAQIGVEKLNEELNQDLINAQREAPPDGSGLHEGFVAKNVNPKTQAFLASISDPELRDRYTQKIGVLRERWANDSVNKEYDLGNAFSTRQVGEMGDARMRGVAENPGAVKDYIREMDDIIDKAPNLTSAQREEMKQKFRKTAPAIVAETLKQTDPEALYFASGNGSNDERIAFLAQRVMPAFSGIEVTPDQVQTAIAKADGDVEEAVGALAKELKLDKQETAALTDVAMSTLGNAKLASGKATGSSTARATSAAEFIAGFEGFRTSTYWDVNHHRVGYGSDTITRADGTVVKVQQGMTVSREDAARDLNRRVGEVSKTVADAGGEGWSKLPDGARNAVISVVYNYGRIPDAVLSAVKSGDKARVANAILSLAGHNGGVNAKRRRKEAMAAISGTTVSASPATTEGSPVGATAAPRSGFVSDVFAEMSTPDLVNMQASADATRIKAGDQQKQQLELATTQAEQTMAEDVASLGQSGQGTIPTADFEQQAQQIFDIVGPEKYAKWIEDRAAAQRSYEYTNDMDGLTEAAISARLEALTPKGGADAVIQQRVFDAATKKAEAVLKARADDPALAVQQLPELKAAAPEVDWQKPDSVQGYLSQVEAAQIMLNTGRALLPKAQATQLGQQIRNVLRASPAPDEAAKNFLAAMEPVYGRFTDDVFMQAYETLLDKDLSKDTRTLVSGLVLQWARETPGMTGWRHNTADEMMATDMQPALDEAKPEERGMFGQALDWLTNAPPPAPPPPAAPELPPAPRARPVTVDGVPAEAVDAYMQNAGNPKIQNMFKRTYGSDALKAMQDQLEERGLYGAAN